MIRLFVALRPPPAIREPLFDLMDGIPGARWQDDDQLHVTIRFVGEIDERQADDLAAALGQVSAPAPTVTLEGVGSFATRGRPHTLWAGIAPRDPLAALHRRVDQACLRAGLAPDHRAFHPHLTLARLSRGLGEGAAIAAWLGRHAGLASPPFTLDHLVLYRSDLGRDGAIYEPVLRLRLGNRDAPTALHS